MDDFLTQHQRKFNEKKALWNLFIQSARDAIKNKLEALKEQKPSQSQQARIKQFVISNMLNDTLEQVHEELHELHFKHEMMEFNLVRKKHTVLSAQALLNKMKLIMACEDPNYRLSLANSPQGGDHTMNHFGVSDRIDHDRMQSKVNFWGEPLELPIGHTYSTMEDL